MKTKGTPGFVGERLRAGREARGIATAAALADMIGVTRAAVSQYELDIQTPSPEVMREISTKLNLPIQQFLQPASDAPGTIFFRSMAAASKAERIRTARQFQWLREISDVLGSFVRFPVVDIPQASVPDDPLRITDDMIEEAAASLRTKWGLGDGPISDMVLLLENKGVILSCLDIETDRIDAFSKWCNVRNRPYVILSTNCRTAVRSRANAAHELGHMVLHRHLTEEDLRKPTVFKEIERQAFRFGAAFLLPERSFVHELNTVSLQSMREVKARWKVAISLMLKRSEDLGIVGETDAKRLWISLSRNGWRTREPLDDRLEMEQPRFLRRCVELLIEKRKIAPLELPLLMKLPIRDIERLTGLKENWLGSTPESVSIEPMEPQILKFPVGNAQ